MARWRDETRQGGARRKVCRPRSCRRRRLSAFCAGPRTRPPPPGLPLCIQEKGYKHDANQQYHSKLRNFITAMINLMHAHACTTHCPPPALHLTFDFQPPFPPLPSFPSLPPVISPMTPPPPFLLPSSPPRPARFAATIGSATPAPPPSPPASHPSRRCSNSTSSKPHGPRGGLVEEGRGGRRKVG